jgi:hypothetical protein
MPPDLARKLRFSVAKARRPLRAAFSLQQDPRAMAGDVRRRADYCRVLGSPLYGRLLDRVAEDVEAAGPCWTVLRDHHGELTGYKLSLRLLASVHRLVLDSRAPELARFYPSCGGVAERDGLFEAFLATVEANVQELRSLVRQPIQTNEVARSAALFGGFLQFALETGRPLRLLELGASAGLNLRWDQYRYDCGMLGWGNPTSPVRLQWREGSPPLGIHPAIVERTGSDLRPIDPCTDEGKLSLMSYIWPDQVSRMDRLRAALSIAPKVPAPVEEADALEWLECKLQTRQPDVATVVFHSLFTQQLSRLKRRQLYDAVVGAGGKATTSSPLAWLQMERGGKGRAFVRLISWPGGHMRLIARATLHGDHVSWCDWSKVP